MLSPTAQNDLATLNVFSVIGVDVPEDQQSAILDEAQVTILRDLIEGALKSKMDTDLTERVTRLLNIGGDEEAPVSEDNLTAVYDLLSENVDEFEKLLADEVASFKVDMLRERVALYKEMYGQNPELMTKVIEAEALMAGEKFSEAVAILNALPQE